MGRIWKERRLQVVEPPYSDMCECRYSRGVFVWAVHHTWEAHSTVLYTVRWVTGKLCKPRLQPQVHQSREQSEDGQHIEEPGTAQTSLQVDAHPQEGSEVEVQVPVMCVVQRGQEEAPPLALPIDLLDTHIHLGTRGVNNVGLTHIVEMYHLRSI